jgi:hypothetical protein
MCTAAKTVQEAQTGQHINMTISTVLQSLSIPKYEVKKKMLGQRFIYV